MSRQNSFDFLRLLGALLVFFSHQFALQGRAEPMFLDLTTLGGLGVTIFFTISGYLITISWLRDPHLPRYTSKRLLRIMPGLIVAVAFCALFLGPLLSSLSVGDYFGHPGVRAYFWNILFYPVYALPGVFTGNPHPHAVNGSLWTLPFEFSLYFVILLVLAIRCSARRHFVIFFSALFMGIFGIYIFSFNSSPVVLYGNDLRFFLLLSPYFFMGSFVASCKLEWMLNIKFAFIMLCLLFLMSGVSLKFLSLIAMPYIILSIGLANIPVLGKSGRFGDFSYGLYIYAFPMQQLAIHLLGSAANQVALFLAAFLPTLVCACVSWHYIEKPMLALKPKGLRYESHATEKAAPSSSGL